MKRNIVRAMDQRVIDWITGGVTRIFVYANNGPHWAIGLRAKIDTGADRGSIDDLLAQAMGLEVVGQVKVKNASGKTTRRLYAATIKFEREKYDVILSGSDRNDLDCPVLLGRDLLQEICLSEEE